MSEIEFIDCQFEKFNRNNLNFFWNLKENYLLLLFDIIIFQTLATKNK